MSLIDLLRMSSGNLKRRKLRTFLTVLGVVIGVASIVVMISLGLGMQQSMYREVEQSGGMTSINVTGKAVGSSMVSSDSNSKEQEATKYVTDDVVAELAQLEHVKSVTPIIEMSTLILQGKYMGYIQLVGMTHEGLEAQNIQLTDGGKLPQAEGKQLELVVGNGVINMFYDKKTGKGYWETGERPDIDFTKDQMFLILDQDAYFQSQNSDAGKSTDSMGEGGTVKKTVIPKKYVVHASGVVAGDPESYNA
ncbi:MAG: ABC transporter permease, partial [Hespellia sp.]|nr:ABC transporter permease [Hespellia sp.]